jgi:uncharacterized protein
MRFEWDSAKDGLNRTKHGLDFETAARLFDDPAMLLIPDRVVDGEQRWHAIGLVRNVIVVVVHVYREKTDGEEIVRIISARQAGKQECRVYLQQAAQ